MAAASAISIFREGEDFYVPQFEVKVAGRGLPRDIVRDVMQVTYSDKVDEIDSFELQINNWDAQENAFKYEPAVRAEFEGIFDPGQRVEVSMGYMNNMRLMLSGEITTIEPAFPQGGGSTLSIRGLNALHGFRRKQHTWAWEATRDSDIAREIGSQPVSEDRPGLGIEVRINSEAANREPEEPFVFMQNQYDILFLLDRARRHGYTVYEAVDPITSSRYLYFGPSDLVRDVTYELEWGRSLAQFRPTLTTANQISKVTVRGWDRRSNRAIEVTVQWGDEGLDINADQYSVARAIEGRHEVITDQPIHTEQQARDLASNILRDQLKEMIQGEGSTVGLPDLRCGRRLHLTKLGPRFSGDYFITATSHTIGDGGYQTTFTAKREAALEE